MPDKKSINLRRIMKTGIFILGLSVTLTRVSVFALIEDNNQNILIEEIREEEVKKGKSIYYAEYYANLIVVRGLNEEEAREQAELFFDKICQGSSVKYADYYAMLITRRRLQEEQARIQAEVYICEISDGRSPRYADCYATLLVTEGIEEFRAREQAEERFGE